MCIVQMHKLRRNFASDGCVYNDVKMALGYLPPHLLPPPIYKIAIFAGYLPYRKLLPTAEVTSHCVSYFHQVRKIFLHSRHVCTVTFCLLVEVYFAMT